MRVVWWILVGLLAGCGVLIKPAPPAPVPFVDSQGHFSVTYPGAFRPTPPADTTVFLDKIALVTTVYEARRLSPTVGFSTILVSQVGAPGLPNYTPQQWVDLFVVELKKRATVLKELPLKQGNGVGRSLIVKVEQRGETTFTQVNYLFAQSRLYQVTLSTKKLELLEDSESQAFFNSFQIKK